MKKYLSIVLLILVSTITLAQGTSGANAKFEYRNLVDLPTTGILSKGFAGFNLSILPFGGVITKIDVAVLNGVSLGISYGGNNIIGSGGIEWYQLPGFNLRIRIINETLALPTITAGFDSQGKGAYDKDRKRYQIKSPGFFVAASKNFELLGYFSVHGVINYSLERDDADKDVNLGVGFEKTIGGVVSLVGEYDFAINDNTGNSLGKGNGYLNLGLRCSIGDGLTLGLDLRDLLDNRKFVGNKADRGFFLEYVKALF